MLRTAGRVSMLLTLVSGVAIPGASVAAQAAPDSVHTVPLFTRNDAYLAAFFVVGTAAMAPLDRHIAQRLQDPNTQANRFLQNFSTDVRVTAVPGSVIIGSAMYAVGRLAHVPELADLGLHGEEAIFIGNVANAAIKWSVGRSRPFVTNDSNPHDFQFMRGFRKGYDYSSFPSGHALAAFAAAAAVTSESGRWWHQGQWLVGTVMYAGATSVAFSRLYNNQHWASDVLMAAGIGTFAGTKVVRYNHRTRPGNRVDKFLLGASAAPDGPGRYALVWSYQF